MRKELRQRLASEYRYAVSRMQQEPHPAKKLFYFSVFYGEAERVLNLEWDRDLALIRLVSQQVYLQINATLQSPAMAVAPSPGAIIYEKLTEAASDLTAYYERPEKQSTGEDLSELLGRLAELSYVVSGNGAYLYEKGFIRI